MFALGNNTIMRSNEYFRVPVETRFNPSILNEYIRSKFNSTITRNYKFLPNKCNNMGFN